MIAEDVPLKIVRRGEYFTGPCEVMEGCRDIKRLRESGRVMVDKNLADQYHGLCTKGGYCSLRDESNGRSN